MPDRQGQHLPERFVPFPQSVSEAARRSLARWAALPNADFPALDDKAAWHASIRRSDEHVGAMLLAPSRALAPDYPTVSVCLDGVACFHASPSAGPERTGIMMDIHGGGFIGGGGALCRMYTTIAAAAFDVQVFGIDYRMPPDYPYPAALDDCVNVYRALLEQASADRIIVRGTSAGGNLGAAFALRARDEGLPMPAALLLITPELDLTESGDSFMTNVELDVVLKGSLMQPNLLYAGGADLTQPYLSPLFGDFSKGFPPTLMVAGTRDLFLSNAARMNSALRRSGNYCELIVEEAMPHSGFFGAPEDQALNADIRNFAERAWSGKLKAASSNASGPALR